MLEHSIRLLIHYLKFWDVPVPYGRKYPFMNETKKDMLRRACF